MTFDDAPDEVLEDGQVVTDFAVERGVVEISADQE